MGQVEFIRKDSGQAGMTKIKHMCSTVKIGKMDRMILYREIASVDTSSGS